MEAMTKRLLYLWLKAKLADKDGFMLLVGGGHNGMPWWNRAHVNEMVSAWRALPRHTQTAFLTVGVNEEPEVRYEDA